MTIEKERDSIIIAIFNIIHQMDFLSLSRFINKHDLSQRHDKLTSFDHILLTLRVLLSNLSKTSYSDETLNLSRLTD